MTTPAPLPRIAPMPKPRPTDPNALPWRAEMRVAVRDGYMCRACGITLLADGDRRVVRVDPAAEPADGNLALLCGRCAADHVVHPQPLEAAHERLDKLC